MRFELLEQLGIKLSKKTEQNFIKYIELFKKYNAHTNLISKNDEEFLFEKHIFDSLAFNLFIKKYGTPKTVMDIGTGGGFPSLPLAILFPEIEIFAVDSTSKKINFILESKEILNLKNINPVASRIEKLPANLKESFDVVTTRALGSLPLILEYSIPYLKKNGYFVPYKSVDSETEILKSQNALKTLKTKLIDTIEYKLPLKENFDRKLLIFKKMDKTSSIYPRTYNIMKKSPL